MGEFNYSGHNPITNKFELPLCYDYMDEYEAFRLGSYYNQHTGSKGYIFKTNEAIKTYVEKKYKTNRFIIKTFNQYRL